MTYREMFMTEYPSLDVDEVVTSQCPYDYWLNARSHADCGPDAGANTCKECWEQEVEAMKKETPTIKDSGDRTKFETGAMRDMREGKGRCDLMPLEVASHFLETDGKGDQILALVRIFQKTGSTEALYTALDEFRLASSSDRKTMLLEVAKHFEEGAKKYGENNWQKGIPVHCYIDSAVRHYLKWLRGDKDEPHDRAFVWNLMCCIWEVDYHKSNEAEKTS